MKTNSFKRFLTALLSGVLLATVAGTTGCLAVAAGAGAGAAVAYVRGELKGTVPAGLDATARATNNAIQALQFAKVSEAKDALSAVFIARTATDKKIEIRLENAGRDVTTVKIRVGLVGDEALSIMILDKIKSHI